MKHIIILLTLFISLEAVELRVASESATKGDKFQIVVAAEGEDVEFDSIESIGGYEIEEKNRVKNTLFINNQITYESRLVMSIYPQEDFVIEPIGAVINGERVYTKAVEIKVNEPKESSALKYFIELSGDKKSAYLKEAIVVRMKLFESKEQRLLDILYSPPSKEGFFVKQRGGEKTYEQDGYIVHEIEYIYYPQKEGILTIDPAKARVGVPVRARDFFGETIIPQHRNIVSNALEIEVNPLPTSVELVGEITLETQVSATKVQHNEPVFFDIALVGWANFDDFGGFKLDIEGVTVFEGVQKIESDRFEQSFSLLGQNSFEIPSFSLSFFDTKSGVERTISSAPISVEIDAEVVPEVIEKIVTVEKEVTNYWKIATAFLFGFMSAVVLVWIQMKRKKESNLQKEHINLQKLMPYCDERKVFDLAKQLYEDKTYKIGSKKIDAIVEKVSKK